MVINYPINGVALLSDILMENRYYSNGQLFGVGEVVDASPNDGRISVKVNSNGLIVRFKEADLLALKNLSPGTSVSMHKVIEWYLPNTKGEGIAYYTVKELQIDHFLAQTLGKYVRIPYDQFEEFRTLSEAARGRLNLEAIKGYVIDETSAFKNREHAAQVIFNAGYAQSVNLEDFENPSVKLPIEATLADKIEDRLKELDTLAGVDEHGNPDERKVFASGAQRSMDKDGMNFYLFPPEIMKRVAKVWATGATKYGPNNHERGMPMKDCLDHLMGHIFDWLNGNDEEDHLAHAICNLMMGAHSFEHNDMPENRVIRRAGPGKLSEAQIEFHEKYKAKQVDINNRPLTRSREELEIQINKLYHQIQEAQKELHVQLEHS